MLSEYLKLISQFDWDNHLLNSSSEYLLLKDCIWWERRTDVLKKCKELSIQENLNSDQLFAIALSSLSIGDLQIANPFIHNFFKSASQKSEAYHWLNIEILGRSRSYKKQAELVSHLQNETFIDYDWIYAACLLSLSHSNVNTKYLLKVLNSSTTTTPMLFALKARLIAGTGDYLEAIRQLEDVEKKWPNEPVIYWLLGTLYGQSGNNQNALKVFRRSLANTKKPILDLSICRFWLQEELSVPYEIPSDNSIIEEIYRIISKFVVTDFRQSGEMAAYILIYYWQRGDYKKCHDLLGRYHSYQDIDVNGIDRPAQIFMKYIIFLLYYWQLNSSLYNKKNNQDRFLYVVGESHALALSNLHFNWCNTNRVGKSSFIMGIKMWHLASASGYEWRSKVQSHIENIIKDSVVPPDILFTIGEIDCRPDEGIWLIHKNKNKEMHDVIAETVRGYIQYLDKFLNNFLINSITIQGVPAPNYNLNKKISLKDVPAFLKMIEDVNHELKKSVQQKGWRFLDVYTATVNEELKSNGVWHLDSNHLQPAFYVQDANKYLDIK